MLLASVAGAIAFGSMTPLASACTCGTRAARLQWPFPGSAAPASLPLLIAARSETDIHIEDAAGRQIPLRRQAELPMLGLCSIPWFLIGIDEDPVSRGHYRLVRAPDDADVFELTAGGLRPTPANLSVTLSVETHAPYTPSGNLCADPKIDWRPFSRTAHLSFRFTTLHEAVPMFATVVVPDPETPEGLGNSMLIRPSDPAIDWLIDLPLEDGADSCATVTVWDAVGVVALADTLCAANAPAIRTAAVRTLVPAGPALIDRGFGCSAAGRLRDPGAPSPVAVLVAVLGLMLRAWRRRPRSPSTRTG